MTWETLKPLHATRGFDGVFVHQDGTIVLGVDAFEALEQPIRVHILVDVAAGLLGLRRAAPDDRSAYGLYAPDETSMQSQLNAVRAFRRLRVSPAAVAGAHTPEFSDRTLVLPVARWAAGKSGDAS